jgi:hypothetical protein
VERERERERRSIVSDSSGKGDFEMASGLLKERLYFFSDPL